LRTFEVDKAGETPLEWGTGFERPQSSTFWSGHSFQLRVWLRVYVEKAGFLDGKSRSRLSRNQRRLYSLGGRRVSRGFNEFWRL